MFEGRVVNRPAAKTPRMDRKWSSEYTYTFVDGAILLLIEFNIGLRSFRDEYSNILAQVFSEAQSILPPLPSNSRLL
jgi:hypothetical protein